MEMNKKNNFILLVEDNPDDVELIIRALEKDRFLDDVQVATDGLEALDFLYGSGKFKGRDTSILPKIIILDLKMPKLNGLDVLKLLQNENKIKDIPVIILTSSTDEYDLVESIKLGATSYISKPQDFNKFSDVLRKVQLYYKFSS